MCRQGGIGAGIPGRSRNLIDGHNDAQAQFGIAHQPDFATARGRAPVFIVAD
jgi:hypothetical protein